MALTQEELSAIGGLLRQEAGALVDDLRQEIEGKLASAAAPAQYHGEPDKANDATAGPDYYVHLANGDIITTKDSASTHMTVDGKSVLVIGRYAVGE